MQLIDAPELRRKNDLWHEVKLAKQVKIEAENWFTDFLEKALDMGCKNVRSSENARKTRRDGNGIQKRSFIGHTLLNKVIQWAEQSNGNNRWLNPDAIEAVKKLKLKFKNA
ncbi:hypothetical protein KI387_034710, partial [Taxus chinensis]